MYELTYQGKVFTCCKQLRTALVRHAFRKVPGLTQKIPAYNANMNANRWARQGHLIIQHPCLSSRKCRYSRRGIRKRHLVYTEALLGSLTCFSILTACCKARRVRTWVFPIRFKWSQDRDSANRIMVVVRSTTRPRLGNMLSKSKNKETLVSCATEGQSHRSDCSTGRNISYVFLLAPRTQIFTGREFGCFICRKI